MDRCRFALAIFVSLIAAPLSMAHSEQASTFTRRSIENMSAQDSARRVLGTIGDLFVERTLDVPFLPCGENCFLTAVTFYTKAHATAEGICGAPRLRVQFAPVPGDRQKLPDKDTPVVPTTIQANEVFNVIRRPSDPGGATAAPRKSIATICSEITSAAHFFRADSRVSVPEAVRLLNEVVQTANDTSTLTFAVTCEGGIYCDSPREFLSAFPFEEIINMREAACVPVSGRNALCYAIEISDPTTPGRIFQLEILASKPTTSPTAFSIKRVALSSYLLPPI